MRCCADTLISLGSNLWSLMAMRTSWSAALAGMDAPMAARQTALAVNNLDKAFIKKHVS